jgi:haloalkane dehalogenase
VDVLRTPDDRFAGLTGWPGEPRYAEVPDPDGGSLRMAWVEEGPADGEPVLLLHGEPTWGYLWRRVVPPLVAAGLRVVVPDLVGFGRSDKPARVADHSYARHVEWVRALAFDALGLSGVTVVGQDWGGLIGLRLVAEHPDRVARYVAANTGLPTGDTGMPQVWWRFREAITTAPRVDVARFVQSGCREPLDGEARRAYDAPFPEDAYTAGPRAMPLLVPTAPDDPASAANRAAWEVLARLDRPALVAFSDGDPITGPMAPVLLRTLPRAVEDPVPGAGHFLQEDRGEQLGEAVARFVRAT